ncbi:MAG: hypothetical protein M0Z92_13110 [Actinomycetota bacterium]|nr:hypothetical protein [Actinomycetota bacterium]
MNRIRVVGAGHHERAAFASALIPRLASAGFKVVVVADLRPRLAADLSSMLEAGADLVRLEGSGIAALVVAEGESARLDAAEAAMGPDALEVVLVAGNGEARAEIEKAEQAVRERLIPLLAAPAE